MPTCPGCGSDKDQTEFGRSHTRADGTEVLAPICRKCWREKHRETCNRASKRWRESNLDKAREYNRQGKRKYRMTPRGRTDKYYSRLVSDILKGGWKNSKAWPFSYSIQDLRTHLENLWKDGMSWENYGSKGWCLDHIVPKCRFPYDTADDPGFMECWALSNLQPLWFQENLKKGIW